jgi:hypothetical protein
MILLNRPAAALAALVLAFGVSSADAAITTSGFTAGKGFTEGNGQNRALVAGTSDLEDADGGLSGYDVGTLTAGEIIGIYGRLVGAVDVFTFEFDGNGRFEVRLDLDGYELQGGGTVAAGQSGFVNQSEVGSITGTPAFVKTAKFSLFDSTNAEIASKTLQTNETDLSVLFGASEAGTYRLKIDGQFNPNKYKAALCDINVAGIAAVPVPFAGLLLLTGLGGAAVAYRRRKPA